jgi:AcrR family transcriptional regulator
MPRSRAASHELKREEILERAAACFAERSYPAASMNDIAAACGTSKARLYHYYPGKDAILFDLLDRHTLRLLAIIGETEAAAERRGLDERAAFHELLRGLLAEYASAATRHVALLNDTRHLPTEQRDAIVARQRAIVGAFSRFLRRAYPALPQTGGEASARAMMVLGMINWTFTWLKPDGPLSYADFAERVIATLDHGLGGAA